MAGSPATDKNSPLKIVVIGSGNVASALAPALDALDGVEIIQIWSRDIVNARQLTDRLRSAQPVDRFDAIRHDAGLYLIAVHDDVITSVACSVRCNPDAVAAHTSGGVEASVLSAMTPHYGVFYPLQTFTKGKPVDLRSVPLFVEGADEYALALLDSLAAGISDAPRHADSRQRAVMHAAAVFACNFTNHCFARADDILRAEGLTLDVLRPLIAETVGKIGVISPAEAQTGPARRNDTRCMAHHEELLTPDQRALYHTLSQAIKDYYNSPK